MTAMMAGLRHAALVLLLVAVVLPAPAQAKVDGDCTMTVQGQDISRDEESTIAAPPDGNLSYRLQASIPVVSWQVTLHYGPFDRIVLEEPFEEGATTQEGVFSVGDYTKYGTGLYRVTGEAALSDGSTCTGIMHLQVEGSPFTTALGLAAVAVLGAAGVGILLLLLQIVLDAKDVVDAAKDFIVEARLGKAIAANTPPRVHVERDPPDDLPPPPGSPPPDNP